MQVKNAINAVSIMPSSCVGSWNFSVDPCDSLSSPQFTCGIDCTAVNGVSRITGLRLEPAGYNGTLSPAVGNLTALLRVVVAGNYFYGPVPGTLGFLPQLIQLDLSSNLFSGQVPPSLGSLTSLQFMSLANNLLEGLIPSSFNNLINVTQMYLDHNLLSGPIPVLSGMNSLTQLDASHNNLTGHLPYGYPPQIMSLSLGQNLLAGRIPQSLGNLTYLAVLDLRNNQLWGGIKKFIFDLPSLQQLNLSYNNFSWLSYNNLTGVNSTLLSVDLSNNAFRGYLPAFFSQLKDLAVLSLRSNFFTGPIPYKYGLRAANALNGTFQLTQLYLDSNFLLGEIPSPFLNLTFDNITASFINNCLQCPSTVAFCQGGAQRPQAECQAFKAEG